MTRLLWTVLWVLLLVCILPATAYPEVANAAAPGGPVEHSQLWKFVARFHSVLLHFPIGILGLVFVFELYSFFRPSRELTGITALALVLGALSAVVVTIMGLMLASEGGYDPETVSRHQVMGITVTVLAVLATVAHAVATRRNSRLMFNVGYRGLLLVTLVALMITGHHGGNLTHGSQYLVKYAPEFVKEIVGEQQEADESAVEVAGKAEKDFVENILPIFESRCYACHGPEKQKGDYRLDVKEVAFGGGENELVAIIPGKPLESNLIRLLILPSDHDDIMPPDGKEPVTADEMLQIIRWIQDGATFVEMETEAKAEPDAVATSEEGSDPAAEPDVTGTDEATGDELASGDAGGKDEPVSTEVARAPGTAQTAEVGLTTLSMFLDNAGKVDFDKAIAPILVTKCIRCHGAKKRRSRLRLHTLEDTLAGGKEDGPALVAGKPDESPMYTRVIVPPEEDEDELIMPPIDEDEPEKPLTKIEMELFRRWIEEGAHWPDGRTLARPDEQE